jgi:hypothetical protein
MQSSSRKGARVRLLAVHTTEGIMRAPALRDFFNRPTAAGSSHAAADETGALLEPEHGYVPYDRAAWTLRNGNHVSENLEFCGWAKWSRADWLGRPKGLDAIARWLAKRSAARAIPLVKLSPADVRAGKSGVIGHVDWTIGMKDGTHWDPGPGFPWDVVLDMARTYLPRPNTAAAKTLEDDMPTADEIARAVWTWQIGLRDHTGALSGEATTAEVVLARTHTIPAAVINGLLDAPIDREAVDRSPTTLRALLAWSDTNTDRLLTSVAAVTAAARVDPEQVAEQVRAAVAEELSNRRITVAADDTPAS